MTQRPSTTSVLDIDKDFNMLSLADLIAARDHYHLHLMAKQHVVGTAIGRYLIRKTDPWPTSRAALNAHDAQQAAAPRKPPRTLATSEVRRYSWPCILVFVDTWVDPADFRDGTSPMALDDVVPRTLYMPDGTRVPVCVVFAPIQGDVPVEPIFPHYPTQFMGGGYPLLVESQGVSHVASCACLVTDGHATYALTNRHVIGEAGEPVYTLIGGERVRIGQSSARQLRRRPFQDVYAGWPGKNVYVNLDAGLVCLDDVNRWTTQVYGIGALGKLADLSVENISLRLIGCTVRAHGCASGGLTGQISALFYRFKSLGGYEYISDLMIGPAHGSHSLTTRPGDSGTLWVLDPRQAEEPPLPLALQWGGQRFVTGAGPGVSPFALATCLSTVCSALEVDVVRDWNLGVTDYWGAVGHYTIATKAVELVGTPGLKQLMQANLDRISFPMEEITKKGTAGLSTKKFVPLADVPDLVWKVGPFKRGGMNSPEHANHFADMDKKDTDGRTLLDICKSPANVTPTVWQRYYDDPKVKDKSHGLLPFRVWQIYQELVGFARKRQYKQFVCAAGILSHYVGDACQPLHISSLFNGDPADSEIVQKRNWRTHKMEDVSVPRAAGVHSAYEDGMVNLHVADIQAALAALRARRSKPINGGYAAAVATVGLMRDTFAAIQPSAIVKAYLPLKVSGQKPQDISDALWAKFGEATIAVMADGARCLAMLWESAWLEGGAPSRVPVTPFRPSELARLYQRESFLPSYTLKTIGAVLDGAPKTTGNGARRAKKKARR